MSPAAPRRALVTGASAGLGRAIAVVLAHDGYDLALTDLAVGMLAETRADPALAGRNVAALALDLRRESDIADAVNQAVAALGGLDLLVNNAGRALQRPAVDVAWAEWDDV